MTCFNFRLVVLLESASRLSRSTTAALRGKPQSSTLKPPLKQPRGQSPLLASRKRDTTTEKKDSELTHNSKGHHDSNQKKDDKVESKTRVSHHKMYDKQHTEDDAKSHEVSSKSHTSRHSKQQHYMDKSDNQKSMNSHSKSPGWSKQTECIEVLEKTNTKASMEHEKYELIEDQPGSDEEVSSQKEDGDISEYSTDDKCVERISYTKVVHCVM